MLVSLVLSVIVLIVVSQVVARRVTAPLDRLVRFVRHGLARMARRAPRWATTKSGRWRRRSTTCSIGSTSRESRSCARKSSVSPGCSPRGSRTTSATRCRRSRCRRSCCARSSRRGTEDRETLSAVLHDIAQVESVVRDLMDLANPGALSLRPGDLNAVRARGARTSCRRSSPTARFGSSCALADGLPPVVDRRLALPAGADQRDRQRRPRRCTPVATLDVSHAAPARRHGVDPDLRRRRRHRSGARRARVRSVRVHQARRRRARSRQREGRRRGARRRHPARASAAAGHVRVHLAAGEHAMADILVVDDDQSSPPPSSGSCDTKGTSACWRATPKTRCAWSRNGVRRSSSWTSACRASTACRRWPCCAAAIPTSTSSS